MKNSNLTVDQEEVYTGYKSVIASMTEEHGMDLCQTHAEAINWEKFLDFLKKLRSRHKRTPITLFMD